MATDANGEDCAPLGNLEDVIRTYGDSWNESDAEARRCLLERSLVPDATYVDPTIDTNTAVGLADAIGAFLTNAPGSSIEQASGLDAREGELRFGWVFKNDGQVVISGVDYMELADDGRIASIRGYWEPLPAEPPPEGPLASYVAAWTVGSASVRRAALEASVTPNVKYTQQGGVVTGLDALVEHIESSSFTITVIGSQTYPKFARVHLEVATDGGEPRRVTDYLDLPDGTKIARIARFEGDLPPLP